MTSFKRALNIVLTVAVFVVVAARVFAGATEVSQDAWRYSAMGLNLAEHGVLTGEGFDPDAAPKPGLGQGGVYTAAEIALAVRLDANTRASLPCVTTDWTLRACDVDIPGLKSFYVVELFLFHMAVLLIARMVFASDVKAWIAVAVSLSFKETHEFANSILSEPAYFMAVGVFLLMWLRALRHDGTLRTVFWCGAALGLLALVKPAWTALLPALVTLGALAVLIRRDDALSGGRVAAAFAIGVLVLVAPVVIRNGLQLGMWTFSDPLYLTVSLAHRFAFNAMSWGEWLAGWLYFLPDFGDKAAESLFGDALVTKLDTGPDSYYVYGRDVLYLMVLSQGGADGAQAILWRDHFFNDPVKAVAVTGLLAWRGLFVGNLMGLAAVVLAAPVLILSTQGVRRDLLWLFVPLLVMVGVHALVSVSIHRYNIGLIVPYALILAQALHAMGAWGIGNAFARTSRNSAP